jgi:hypothetical protein
MATVGEILWAGLISSRPVFADPSREVSHIYLTFHFGRYIRFSSPVVAIRDFRIEKFVWDVPSIGKPGVYVHFLLKRRGDFTTSVAKFRLHWGYGFSPIKGGFRVTFPVRSAFQLLDYNGMEGTKYNRRLIYFRPPGSSPLRRVNPRALYLGPHSLLSLSLIARVLVPKGVFPSKPRNLPSTPFPRKLLSPRPSPEVKTILYKRAVENFPDPYVEFTNPYETSRRTWTGSTTPGFGKVRPALLRNNPHTVTWVKTDYDTGYDLRRKIANPNTTYTNAWGPDYYLGGATTQPILLSEAEFSSVANKALTKLNSRANLGVTANMAQNIVQYKQTTNMIAKNAVNIAASLLLLKKGQFTKAADKLLEGNRVPVTMKRGSPTKSKSLANNWLELQYGWKPLLSDVDESMRILAGFLTGGGSGVSTVSGSAVIAKQGSTPIFGPGSTSIPVGWRKTQSFWSCRFGIKYKVVNSKLSYLSQLGFTNPINLFWEILPYSFVVDWFIPIGPYLESLSAPHGVELVDGYRTKFGRRILTQRSSWSGKMPGDSSAEFRCYGGREEQSVNLERIRLTAWPTQALPTFKNPFSETHVLNALALLRQSFGRR